MFLKERHLGQRFFPYLQVELAFNSEQDEIAVYCPDRATLQSVTRSLQNLYRFCDLADVSYIATWVMMDGEWSQCDRISIKTLRCIMEINGTFTLLSDVELYNLFGVAAEKGQSLSLVSNDTHQGILTTNNESCGISVGQWIGADMSQYWEAAELHRYLTDIEAYGKLTNYQWTAFQMDEGRKKIEQVGDIRRVKWHGIDCRLVSVKELTVLG